MNPNIFDPPIPTEINREVHWQNLKGSSVGLALVNLTEHTRRPMLIIAPDNLYAGHLIEALNFFGTSDSNILQFPDWETLPYDHFSPHQDIISTRISTLSKLPTLESGVIVTTTGTLMQRLPPQEFLGQYSFLLKLGDLINIDVFRTKLANAGYRNVSQVTEHGEYAIRGSIIDLFPMGSKTPFRIDLLDNEVDSIRLFSPETQRSLEKISEINLLPAKEFPLTDEAIEHFRKAWRDEFTGNPLKSPLYQDISEGITFPGIEYYLPLFFDKTATFFDYLPAHTLIVTISNVNAKAQEFWHEIDLRYNQAQYDITRPILKPDKLFLSANELSAQTKNYSKITIDDSVSFTKDLPLDGAVKPRHDAYVFKTEAAPTLEINSKSSVPLNALKEFVAEYQGRILFCAESTGRREVILQLFKTISLHPSHYHSWQAFLSDNQKHGIIVVPLEEGFCLQDEKICLLTETQLYGKRVMQRRLRKKTLQDPDAIIKDLTELQINDPVVHIHHGVGRYLGLQTLNVGEQLTEFLALEYQGGDKLYVPVASLHLISRYTGAEPEHVIIHRLGTDHWQKAKKKAAEKVRDVAAELLDLYAKRAARPGHVYQIPEPQYSGFTAAFPFEETPDQLNAIEQVFTDMTSTKPMDRVICGDVGFGKTEVAMRAAFLTVHNNKQVVVLVPTTLLAQQHFQNFQDRFADSAIQVEVLSRFRTGKEQQNVLNRLAEGKVDIVIGTHKLLQSDIKFKELGLVIIDEEHRFGVKQKEKLKALRSNVDILTLTATPIPRTLNMALSGIRDLSVIATPPAKRLSVKTFIHEYAEHIIQEAVQREIMRGGQVYFLHNEISTINKKAEDIQRLVGEARVAVAHGQMHERELERIMSAFYHRQFNVLVCSTIIESGIDIPTANTILINRADKFGIAQLYQLRGRVGRSHHQAYAYLLVPARTHLTADAVKRLDAISALQDLGIGFTLATHDLEIRGAGELLGEEQSGNMQEVGFSLYMDLLSRAVAALKEGKEPDLSTTISNAVTEIDLHIPALIPENYLNDVQLRLQFYKRIANAKNQSELDEIQVTMIDRFGLLPKQLKNLFALSELKLKANEFGIIKLEATEKGGKIEFNDKPNVKPERIIQLIQSSTQRFKLDGPTRLRFTLDEHDMNDRVNLIHGILNELQ